MPPWPLVSPLCSYVFGLGRMESSDMPWACSAGGGHRWDNGCVWERCVVTHPRSPVYQKKNLGILLAVCLTGYSCQVQVFMATHIGFFFKIFLWLYVCLPLCSNASCPSLFLCLPILASSPRAIPQLLQSISKSRWPTCARHRSVCPLLSLSLLACSSCTTLWLQTFCFFPSLLFFFFKAFVISEA